MAKRNFRHRVLAALLLASLVLAACSTPRPVAGPVAPQPGDSGTAESEPTIPVIEEPPPVVAEPAAAPATLAPVAPVAIVLASREPAYEAVVHELDRLLDDYSVYDLADKSQPPETAFRAIDDDDALAVVAVGLRAARAAVLLSRRPVIFSQVFNYNDFDLLTDNSRGVESTAPLDAQLAAWQQLDPDISNVGFIIGEGHDRLVEAATLAALEQGVNLIVRISRSDQETLYFYRRMVADIDGFWMMPDNRILSARVIREIIDDAQRRNVAVAVANDNLLPLGAAVSFTTSASDIAETIVGVLHKIQSDGVASVPELTALSEIRVQANDSVLQKRGLTAHTLHDAEEAE